MGRLAFDLFGFEFYLSVVKKEKPPTPEMVASGIFGEIEYLRKSRSSKPLIYTVSETVFNLINQLAIEDFKFHTDGDEDEEEERESFYTFEVIEKHKKNQVTFKVL